MREALGLAPKRSSQPQGNRLDKHELSELVKRGSTAEDLGAGHAEAAQVHGLGFAKYVVYLHYLNKLSRYTCHSMELHILFKEKNNEVIGQFFY